MNKIILSVKDENIGTVMTILNNLKDGLITSIETGMKSRTSQYRPKAKVIYEHESGTHDTSGKYSAAAYRERLKKK